MRWMSFVMAAAMFGACAQQPGAEEFAPPTRFDNVGNNGDSNLVSGRIDGRLGRFDVESNDVYGYVAKAGRRHLMADIRGRDNGVLMAFFELQNVRPSELEVGDLISGGMDNMGDPSMMGDVGGDPGVFMYACAGERDDEWEEDVPADDVDVEVTEKNDEDGTITLGFHGHLMTGQTIQGSFTVALNQTESVE